MPNLILAIGPPLGKHWHRVSFHFRTKRIVFHGLMIICRCSLRPWIVVFLFVRIFHNCCKFRAMFSNVKRTFTPRTTFRCVFWTELVNIEQNFFELFQRNFGHFYIFGWNAEHLSSVDENATDHCPIFHIEATGQVVTQFERIFDSNRSSKPAFILS